MSLPEIPEFEEMLSSFSLTSNLPTGDSCSIRVPLHFTTDQSGSIVRDSELWLSFAHGTRLSLDSLVARIRKELRSNKHADSEQLALFVLSFAVLLRPMETNAVRAVNTVLSSICAADVNLYFAFFAELPEYHLYEITPFHLGPIRAAKLKWNCERAQSDFFDRYGSKFRRTWGVEREPKATLVLNISTLRDKLFAAPLAVNHSKLSRDVAWESLVNGYFSHLNELLFADFLYELVASQDVLLTMGAPLFDLRTLTPFFESMRIAIFLNIGSERGGFVAPSSNGPLVVDLVNAHKRNPQIVQELKDKYSFTKFDSSPLHSSVKLFASFVARGRKHQIEGRSSEALIHYVIALELIFGERQGIQRSVSERVAVILFGALGRSFNEHLIWLDRLYDTRSHYVHSGKLVSDELLLEDVRDACEHCFRCLLRMQKASANQSEIVLSQWLETLDFLAKGMIAAKVFDQKELIEAHLL